MFYLTEENNEDMEGFNDVWANILEGTIIDRKQALDCTVLEPPSKSDTINLNVESNFHESSMESMLPPSSFKVNDHIIIGNQHQ